MSWPAKPLHRRRSSAGVGHGDHLQRTTTRLDWLCWTVGLPLLSAVAGGCALVRSSDEGTVDDETETTEATTPVDLDALG
ncbi:MAG: hypothetical protein GY773_09485, partial [Actinomycetia bacterium]|nr:hypothetical protein [Actinomycetes bacterium]